MLLSIGKSILCFRYMQHYTHSLGKKICGRLGRLNILRHIENMVCLVQQDGNGVGRGRRMGSSSPPRMVLSCPPRPTSHDGKYFLTPSLLLEASRSPAPPCKTLLFVSLPYNQYNFFNETYFINKNILEITNLSHQIK